MSSSYPITTPTPHHLPSVTTVSLSPLSDWYFTNSFFYLMVNISLPMIDYFIAAWWSFLYVFGWPVFAILMLSEEWELKDIKYNEELLTIGIEWLQYVWINDWY